MGHWGVLTMERAPGPWEQLQGWQGTMGSRVWPESSHSAFPKQVRREVTTCMGEELAVRGSIAFVSTAIGQFVIMKMLAMGKSLSSGSSAALQKTGAGRRVLCLPPGTFGLSDQRNPKKCLFILTGNMGGSTHLLFHIPHCLCTDFRWSPTTGCLEVLG